VKFTEAEAILLIACFSFEFRSIFNARFSFDSHSLYDFRANSLSYLRALWSTYKNRTRIYRTCEDSLNAGSLLKHKGARKDDVFHVLK